MKSLAFTILVFAFSFSYSQALFPLQSGNIWEYQSADVIYPAPSLQVKVLGDTVLRNGKSYSLVSGIVFGVNFMRQELSKVYGFDLADSVEYVLFDFASQSGDTLSTHANGKRTIIMTGTLTDTTHHVTYFSYREMAGTGPSSYGFYDWTIRDSVGVVRLTMEPGNSWNLSGALINGQKIGTLTEVEGSNRSPVPGSPILFQNFPNPFNPLTTIRFLVSTRTAIRLDIFNSLGQRITTLVDSEIRPGEHSVSWDASRLPSGTYFCRLRAGSYSLTRQMYLVK